MPRPIASILTTLWLLLFGITQATATELVTEEFMVDAAVPGTKLYVRNKHPEDMTPVPASHVLLYVHGATLPSEATFDLPIDGMSWMDYIASAGWDVYLMDVRGYGRSTRPAEFSQPEASEAPIVWTEMKVADVGSVVDFILERRGLKKISLLGWSWGTIVTATYTASHQERVQSLVLHAPVWCEEDECAVDPNYVSGLAAEHTKNPQKGPIVSSIAGEMRKRLQAGAPEDRLDEILPAQSFETLATAALASDPDGAKRNPPVMRSPPGVGEEFDLYWGAGKAFFDPKLITAPTLVVTAEWDGRTPVAGSASLHGQLSNSPKRQLTVLTEGSHLIMLEKNRMQLFEAVQGFLNSVTAPP